MFNYVEQQISSFSFLKTTNTNCLDLCRYNKQPVPLEAEVGSSVKGRRPCEELGACRSSREGGSEGALI